VHADKPVWIELAAVGDEIARPPLLAADLAQPVRVRAVLRADHQNHVDLLAQLAYRGLTILRRVADVAGFRTYKVAELALQGGDDTLRVVHAQCGLRHVGDRRVGGEVERLDVGFALHQDDWARDLAHRALDLGMAGMSDQDELAALPDVALALVVHLGHQRTGRVEHRQIARGGLLLDALGEAVGAEDGHRVGGNFGQILDEPRTLRLEVLHDMLVMDDLVADIDRRPVLLERTFDDLDRANDAGTESTRLGQDNFHSIHNSADQPASLCPRRDIEGKPVKGKPCRQVARHRAGHRARALRIPSPRCPWRRAPPWRTSRPAHPDR